MVKRFGQSNFVFETLKPCNFETYSFGLLRHMGTHGFQL